MIYPLAHQFAPSQWGPKKGNKEQVLKKMLTLISKANMSPDYWYTLTTDAPVANFFPSFFEASLSLTPNCPGNKV